MLKDFFMFGFVLSVIFVVSSGNSLGDENQFITLLGQDDQVRLKKPPARFNHDMHTEKHKKNCALCHYTNAESSQVCLLVKGSDKTKEYEQSMHSVCFSCHQQETDQNNSVPLTCKQCHDKKFVKKMKPLRVIYRHGDHQKYMKDESGCLNCHIKANERKLKPISACQSCHDDQQNKVATNRKYTHLFCFQCHFNAGERKNITCITCHNIPPDAIFPTVIPENK